MQMPLYGSSPEVLLVEKSRGSWSLVKRKRDKELLERCPHKILLTTPFFLKKTPFVNRELHLYGRKDCANDRATVNESKKNDKEIILQDDHNCKLLVTCNAKGRRKLDVIHRYSSSLEVSCSFHIHLCNSLLFAVNHFFESHNLIPV